MRAVQHIFVNKGLNMSVGKACAQASHAAVEGYRISKPELIKEWYKGGHYTKLVMQANDEESIRTIERYLKERGVKSKIIIDEAATELDGHRITALGCEIVDKDEGDTEVVFSSFKLYRDTIRFNMEIDR